MNISECSKDEKILRVFICLICQQFSELLPNYLLLQICITFRTTQQKVNETLKVYSFMFILYFMRSCIRQLCFRHEDLFNTDDFFYILSFMYVCLV